MDLHAIEIDDRRLEYACRGEGPPLLLMHGGCCTADDWAPLVPELEQDYRLIIPDSFAYEVWPWGLWRLLDHLQVDAPVLLGHSWGGSVVREMYRLCPDRVAAMIVIDSAGAGELQLARRLPNDRYNEAARALYARNRQGMAKLREHHRGDYPSEVTIERRLAAYARAREPLEARRANRPKPLAAPVAATPEPSPIPDTGAFITCPTLVIQTGRGKFSQLDIGRLGLKDRLQAPDLTYVLIENAGHWPWLEDQATFLRILRGFLAPVG